MYDSPRVSSQYIFCSFPFVLDSYDGCCHYCKYCFSYFNYLINQATKNKNFSNSSETINIKNLENVISLNPKTKSQRELCEFVKRRIPIHWGGISDPFSPFEEKTKTSLKILKLFQKYEYPFIVSTKNSRIINKEYFEVLKKCKYKVVQVSLISLNKKLEQIEPHPEVKIENRLKIIEKCSKNGIRVVVRIQPFIPFFCEDGLEDLIKKVSELGAKAVTIEYLKLGAMTLNNKIALQSYNELSKILGYDILKFYKKFGKKTQSDIELDTKMKKRWILKTKELAHKYNLEFYCADNKLRDLGDGYCCCGVGDEKGFERKNKFNISKLLFDAKEKKIITINDYLNEDADLFDKISLDWFNLGNYKKRNRFYRMSAKDKAIKIWNSKGVLSPCKFFENIEYMGKDKNKNAIYKYKNKT